MGRQTRLLIGISVFWLALSVLFDGTQEGSDLSPAGFGSACGCGGSWYCLHQANQKAQNKRPWQKLTQWKLRFKKRRLDYLILQKSFGNRETFRPEYACL